MVLNRKWDVEDTELNKKCIDEVISRVEELENSDEVGIIAAQDIIDIVTENLAPVFYNQGVEDARKTVQDKIQDIEVDLDVLKQK